MEELLRQQPGGEPLPPDEALDYLHQIAAALDFAHDRRFVHRDVKPGNVLIDLVGTPRRAYLVDFGVTKDLADNAKATQYGLFLGTAEYASPEQIHGVAINGRSDVYSLACTAFELFTGSSPFAAGPDDTARIAAHLSAPIPSAVERRPSLPAALDWELARGLSKDAAGRPASTSRARGRPRRRVRRVDDPVRPSHRTGGSAAGTTIAARSPPVVDPGIDRRRRAARRGGRAARHRRVRWR